MFFSGLKNWMAIKRSNSNFAIFFITFIWGYFCRTKIQIFVTTTELIKALNYVNATRDKRLEVSRIILDHPHLISPLMAIAFEDKGKFSSKACWILEFVAKEDMGLILENIDDFVFGISKVQLDSSVRPIAKICEILMKAYFSKSLNEVQNTIKESHMEKITTSCFDWLIGEHKVAAKAYSMTCLYLLGKNVIGSILNCNWYWRKITF